MSFRVICTSCMRHLHKYYTVLWRQSPFTWIQCKPEPQRNLLYRRPSQRSIGVMRCVSMSSAVKMISHKQELLSMSHFAQQKSMVDYSPNIHLDINLDSANSTLKFGDNADLVLTLEMISDHISEMTPKDLSIAVNKLWECIWLVRGDTKLWLENLEILHNHPVLHQLCNLIQVHVSLLSNAEALNILYLLVKFGAPHILSPAIAKLYHTLSLGVHTFSLSDTAMFARCSQSVKDVVPQYGINTSETGSIMKIVLTHVQELLVDDYEYDIDPLPRLLLGLLHCSIDTSHPAVHNIVKKLYHAVDVLDSVHMSPLSKAVMMMNRQQSPLAGLMTSRMSDILDDIHSPSDFSHIFYTLITLCSEDLELRITERCLDLFVRGASYGFNDIRRVIQGAVLMKNKKSRNLIITEISHFLVPQVPAIPVIEMCIIYTNLKKVYSQNFKLLDLLEKQMKKHLLECTSPHQLVALIEVLSHNPSQALVSELVRISIDIIHDIPLDRLGRLCSAMGRMKVRTGKFPSLVEDCVLNNIDSVMDVTTLKNISHYLATSKSTNAQLQSVFIERLQEILMKTSSPHLLVYTLDSLSSLGVPLLDIDTNVWDKVLVFLPILSGHDLRRVFFVLTLYSNRLSPKTLDTPQSLVKLLEFVKKPLYCTEAEATTQTKETGMKNSVLDATWIQDPHSAVAFSKLLTQQNIYNEPILAAIESTITSHIEDVSPFHVRDILDVFTCSNYYPQSPSFLEDLCTERIVPYISDLPPPRLIHTALSLASLQCFPLNLLQSIFCVDFLESLEEMRVSRFSSCQLKELNRAVCLECPQLRIPWFSQDEAVARARKLPSYGIKLDVGSVLQDILGGPSFLGRNTQTPYSYNNDFECILDHEGQPITYTSQRLVSGDDLTGRSDGLPSSSSSPFSSSSSSGDCRRIAIDIIPPSEMCFNTKRYSSFVEMKRRHLEILCYEYITIPYTDWIQDHLSSFEAKHLYLSELLGGNIWPSVTETEHKARPGPGTRKMNRTNDLVERMLEEWGE